MEIEGHICRPSSNEGIRCKRSDSIYLPLPRRSWWKKRLRNVLWLDAGHKRQVVGCQRVALPDLLKRYQPRCGHWIFDIAISPVVLEFLAEKLNDFYFLVYQEQYIVPKCCSIFIDIRCRLDNGQW